MSIRQNRRVVVKTADYTISQAKGDAPGTIFSNRGATVPIIFTLPAPTRATTGWFYDFRVVAAFSVTVKGPAIDQLVAFNDALASQVAILTAGQMIGGAMRAESDGVSWIVTGRSVGTTFTVTA